MIDSREALAAEISACMVADRDRLRSRLRGIERFSPDQLERFRADVQRSVERRVAREANLPKPTFPQDLPVVQRRQEIADAIAANQVIVLSGETGSGKTTQLPKICLDLGRGAAGPI